MNKTYVRNINTWSEISEILLLLSKLIDSSLKNIIFFQPARGR